MNLKVIYNQANDNQQTNNFYSITKSDDSITINFKGTYQGKEVAKQAIINLNEYKGKVARVTLQTIWKPAEVYIAPMYELASKYREFQEIKNDALPIARVFIPINESDIIVLLEQPFNYSSPEFECIKRDSEHTTSGMMIALSNEFEQLVKRHIRKRDTICKIDIYDTVTYLESQVDSLTTLVLNIIKDTHLDNDILLKARDILQESQKYSVLDIKPTEKILSEIKSDKSAVREMQKELFNEK